MYIKTENIVIRAFAKKDIKNLYTIVRETAIYRFMPDWADEFPTLQDYEPLIDWFIKQQDTIDISIGRRYAVASPDTDDMIGMVGIGLEETLNEIEVAYFMSENNRKKGYMKEAIIALVEWCFQVSDIKYLILTIDCANTPSNKLAEKCGFHLFEKRMPIGHKQPNMESDSYYYYRKYRI
ncbi:GNAT family protein [Fusobacterium sp.]|uniref:GNAT family N-acetyltransferase n=1 Tax=Fusobacterium sp. TaxID=68766 RepID=UPI0028FFC770|nr:GNAT family protein [Fusobacterium sp.]MDU1912114.1 GNAT family protein [Fusobacterium sp.]